MSRRKKLTRPQHRTMVANMLDLGFTVPAISYMINRTQPSLYTLLRRMGRIKGGDIVRKVPSFVDPETTKYLSRVFHYPDVMASAMQFVGVTAEKAKTNGKNGHR